jgi:hypothetical protein
MPRLAGLDAAGVLRHVMIRGIECRDIFEDDADREEYIGHMETCPVTGVSTASDFVLSCPAKRNIYLSEESKGFNTVQSVFLKSSMFLVIKHSPSASAVRAIMASGSLI